MDLVEKTIASQNKYRGKIVNVREDRVLLPSGVESPREIVEHPGAVAVVPVDEKGNVILIRQFRKATEKILWEIPAGKLEPAESPEECARRELQEEIGRYPQRLEQLCSFYTSPGFCDEIIHLFLATELSPVSVESPPHEFVEPVELSFVEAVQKCMHGEFNDAKTIIGLLMAKRLL